MKQNQIISILILLIVVGGAAFFGGTKYQQKKTISQFGQRMANNTNVGQQGTGRGAANSTGVGKGGNGFNQTIGEISKIDENSITIKTNDGGSKIILISDSTIFRKSTDATKTDLIVGDKIAVMGDTNTDGSLTGKNIEINPHVATITPAVKQ